MAYLQDELPAAERAGLTAHLAGCPACARELEAFHRTRQTLAVLALEKSPDLAPAILARVAEEEACPAAQHVWNRMLFRAAAVLLGLLSVGLWCWYGPAHRAPKLVAQQPASRPAPIVTPAARPPDEAAAIRQALAWLESTQEPDGCWNATRWGAQQNYTVGLTALAVLALGADRSAAADSGPRAETLRRGLHFLVSQQDARGQFGPDGSWTLYNQGLATLALLEAWARRPEPAWRTAAQRGLAFINATQDASGGWGYARGPRDNVNAAVTVWQLHTLIRAHALGFENTRPAVLRGLAWMEQTVRPDGYAGYRQAHDFPFGPDTLTAAGALCLSRAGVPVDPARLNRLLQATRAAAGQPPTPDYHRSYFIAAALQAEHDEQSRTWLARQRAAVLAGQLRAGPAAGSWEPCDPWSRAGGRIYATTMAVLTLQAL